MANLTPTQVERFLEKIQPEPMSGCWLWTGRTDKDGYGLASLYSSPAQGGNGKYETFRAHRLSFRLAGKSNPDNLDLDHKCRVRCCVNPDHLEPVTKRQNQERSPLTLISIAAAKTHCKYGHAMIGENVAWTKSRVGSPVRVCKACAKRRWAGYNAKYRSSGRASLS